MFSAHASKLLRYTTHARGWTNENVATAMLRSCKVRLNMQAARASNHNMVANGANHLHIQLALVVHHKDVATMNEHRRCEILLCGSFCNRLHCA